MAVFRTSKYFFSVKFDRGFFFNLWTLSESESEYLFVKSNLKEMLFTDKQWPLKGGWQEFVYLSFDSG